MSDTFGLSSSCLNTLKKLNSPKKIQEYLDTLPFNYEKDGETCMSPVCVMKEKKAHCIEGAMFAALALMLQGEKPLLLSLKVKKGVGDYDHVVTLYKKHGYWGAISKTNHAVLRFRDPVYKSVRELAMSYFHEYFLTSSGEKTMIGYSAPINLMRYGARWITSPDDLFDIAADIYDMKHNATIPKVNKKYITKVTEIERRAASIKATTSKTH
jgi:hypothetical protein